MCCRAKAVEAGEARPALGQSSVLFPKDTGISPAACPTYAAWKTRVSAQLSSGQKAAAPVVSGAAAVSLSLCSRKGRRLSYCTFSACRRPAAVRLSRAANEVLSQLQRAALPCFVPPRHGNANVRCSDCCFIEYSATKARNGQCFGLFGLYKRFTVS